MPSFSSLAKRGEEPGRLEGLFCEDEISFMDNSVPKLRALSNARNEMYKMTRAEKVVQLTEKYARGERVLECW